VWRLAQAGGMRERHVRGQPVPCRCVAKVAVFSSKIWLAGGGARQGRDFELWRRRWENN
jgi:hypothetical protein